MIKDGETVVIGGLLKDVKTKYDIGVPLLKNIPILGWFFRRSTYDTQKIDLLIFITAKIVEPGELIFDEVMETSSVPTEFKLEKAKEK
jgi:type II secretory pathway component GspD/PulD (secretin)